MKTAEERKKEINNLASGVINGVLARVDEGFDLAIEEFRKNGFAEGATPGIDIHLSKVEADRDAAIVAHLHSIGYGAKVSLTNAGVILEVWVP